MCKIVQKIGLALLAGALVFSSFSCASVERVGSDDVVELDGFWNDTDVKLVCDDIIGQILNSARIQRWQSDRDAEIAGMKAKIQEKKNMLNDSSVDEFDKVDIQYEIEDLELELKRLNPYPIITIGSIRNDSSEYIDTQIVSNNLKTSIIKSGMFEFMASSDVRDALRDEVAAQSDHADYDKQKEMDVEDAADFMLTGSIKTMVQFDGKKTSVRTYMVTIELNDVETHRTLDIFEPAENPKKVFKGKRR